MKISKIQRQKKDPQRYSIYINDQFAFGVDEQILIDFSLNKGKDLDQGLVDAILAAEAQQKLYLKGLNYLSYGLKSTKEMQDYLKKQVKNLPTSHFSLDQVKSATNHSMNTQRRSISLVNFDEDDLDFWQDQVEDDLEQATDGQLEARDAKALDQAHDQWIQAALDRLTGLGLLNDHTYALAYLRTQAQVNRKGPQKIDYELRRKGVAQSIIQDALEEYPQDLLRENIQHLSRKFIQSKRRLSPQMLKNKLFLHLLQKGYSKEQVDRDFDPSWCELSQEETDQRLDKAFEKSLKRRQRKLQGYELKQALIRDLMTQGFSYESIQTKLNDSSWENTN